MNELTLFNNPEFGEIRTIETNDGKVIFCAKDVAKSLGYKDTVNAIKAHCRWVVKCSVPHPQNPDKTIEMAFIPESDVYRLTFSSKLPNAEKFTDWITEEVIPQILRTGSYTMNGKAKKANPNTEKRLAIQEMNAKARIADRLLKAANAIKTRSETYGYILTVKAAEMLIGEQLNMLPKVEQKMYYATEVAEMLGTTAQKIGRLANAHELKTAEYGEWYKDKAKNANKEVDVFKYNDKAVEKFKELLAI